MKITVTAYGREDGVALLKINTEDNAWWLRSTRGPSWFWNPDINDWELEPENNNMKRFNLTKEQGLELLKTVTKKTY